MYCIYQINDSSNEFIIDIIESENQFLDKIIDLLKTINLINYQILECITIDDIKNDAVYHGKNYLLKNNSRIELVQKIKHTDVGFFYNSSYYHVNVLFMWKLIEYKGPLNKNLTPKDNSEFVSNNQSKINKPIIKNIIEEYSDYITSLRTPKRNIEKYSDNSIKFPKKINDYDVCPSISPSRNSPPRNNPKNSLSRRDKLFLKTLSSSQSLTDYGSADPSLAKSEINVNPTNPINSITPTNKFRISKFSFNTMIKNPAILIIGKRSTGKSYIVRDLLKYFNQNEFFIENSLICSLNEKFEPFYQKIYPTKKITHHLDDVNFENYLLRCSKNISNKRTELNGCVVLDNVLVSKKWVNNDFIKELMMNGRHYHSTMIITTDYVTNFPPHIRCNFDYVFILKEYSTLTKKKLYDNFAGILPNFDSFDKIFSSCTENYHAMVIDNHKPTLNISEKIFWYCASNEKFDTSIERSDEIFMQEDPITETSTVFDNFKTKILSTEEIHSDKRIKRKLNIHLD